MIRARTTLRHARPTDGGPVAASNACGIECSRRACGRTPMRVPCLSCAGASEGGRYWINRPRAPVFPRAGARSFRGRSYRKGQALVVRHAGDGCAKTPAPVATPTDSGAGHAADLQHADAHEGGVPSHRARARTDVRVRHDRVRLLSSRSRQGARGVRRGRPLSAQRRLPRDVRAQHHRHRRQDHRPCERER